MRQYSNFLLFEGLLDTIPSDLPAIKNLAKAICTPSIKIVSADCNTFLGEPANVDYDREGDIATDTKIALTGTRLNSLLAANTSKVFVRKVHNCTADGGVCQLCYKGTYQFNTLPAVSSIVPLIPEYVGKYDILTGTGTTQIFQLGPVDFTASRTVVYYNGEIVNSATYTVDPTALTITFNTALVVNTRYIVKRYHITNDGLLGFFAKTYSSSLFGIKEIPTVPLLLRESFYNSLITDGDLDYCFDQLKTLQVPGTHMDYYSRITSKLEKALFILYTYILYVSVIP